MELATRMKIRFIFLLAGLLVALLMAGTGKAGEIHTLNAETKTIRLPSGIQLEYAEQGNRHDQSLIFLHGYSDSWKSFEKILPLMPGDLHVIAVTLRGHGNSSKPLTGYRFADLAADIASFIKKKKLGPSIIAGHSLGGLVAQQFAIDYPSLTKALVIVSSDPWFYDNPGFPEFSIEVAKLSDPVDYAFADGFQRSTIANPIDEHFLKQCVEESLKLPADVWWALMESMREGDYNQDIHRITAPTLIVWGDKDQVCPGEAQDRMKKEISRASLIVYEGIGHALHWEEPERFAEDLLLFVRSL